MHEICRLCQLAGGRTQEPSSRSTPSLSFVVSLFALAWSERLRLCRGHAASEDGDQETPASGISSRVSTARGVDCRSSWTPKCLGRRDQMIGGGHFMNYCRTYIVDWRHSNQGVVQCWHLSADF